MLVLSCALIETIVPHTLFIYLSLIQTNWAVVGWVILIMIGRQRNNDSTGKSSYQFFPIYHNISR